MVSPRFCGQHLRGRVWWHRSGIPTFLQLNSSWPSLVARQWYPHGFAVNIFVAEFGGMAVVSPRHCSQHLRGRVWWHRTGVPTILRSTSSWPRLVAPQWYPHGFAFNIFVAKFADTALAFQGFAVNNGIATGTRFSAAVASPRFAVNLFMVAPSLLQGHPRGSRMGLVRSSRPLLLMLVAVVCVDGSDWHLKPLGRR